MADNSKIEWTDATWNPVNGCSVHSPGCTNCYAMKQAHRVDARRGLTVPSKGGMVWTGEVRLNEKALTQPLHWRKPRRIFVCAHGDLFHEAVPDEWIDRVFAVMALCPQHTFQVLTKRSDRMRAYLTKQPEDRISKVMDQVAPTHWCARQLEDNLPLPNVWLGVSVEDQTRADERIPDLLDTPAAVRWLSCEPLLEELEFRASWMGRFSDCNSLDWIVAGGESGHHARGSTEMVEAAMRSLRDQCAAAGVAFFAKQNFKKLPLPDDLLVREYPTAPGE
jgi:protein gp37